jgi:hypothetical protein
MDEMELKKSRADSNSVSTLSEKKPLVVSLSFAVWQRLSVTTNGFFYLSEQRPGDSRCPSHSTSSRAIPLISIQLQQG